ncbi:MAG: UDP-N-acetylmuramoyl-L-alanyl-D-glutamate--2,6-diaminopimelate ligase [Pseudomonadota bacterium]
MNDLNGTNDPSGTNGSGATLASLGLTALEHAGPAPDPETRVSGIAVDSRDVRPGHLFVAVPGTRLDGARFAPFAIRQGAVGVVASREGLATLTAEIGALPVPVFLSEAPRAALSRLAAAFHPGQPAMMAAITGTNGKTSVAQFLRQIWAQAGAPAAALGTLGVSGKGFEAPLGHTTPEPITLHRALARLHAQGCTHASLEASSHGLAQARLDGVSLMAAALTNITRDHLDYHPTHEDYVAAKLRLFALLGEGGTAVVNAADPVAPRVGEIAAVRGLALIRVGREADADLRIAEQAFLTDGQSLTLIWQGRSHTARLGLVGAFQAENVAIAAALALATGTPAEAVFAALPQLEGVPGRMQQVASRAGGAAVYVDYAHTPDALATALDALRPHTRGRLAVVFGAGGDRDPGKRPLMGEAAAKRAEVVIVTDDNPRSEDPAAIRRAVMAGCPEAHEIGERAAAILAGVDALKGAGDALLIAGKGHERGQEIAGEIRPFDDAEQARASVAALDGIAPATGE